MPRGSDTSHAAEPPGGPTEGGGPPGGPTEGGGPPESGGLVAENAPPVKAKPHVRSWRDYPQLADIRSVLASSLFRPNTQVATCDNQFRLT